MRPDAGASGRAFNRYLAGGFVGRNGVALRNVRRGNHRRRLRPGGKRTRRGRRTEPHRGDVAGRRRGVGTGRDKLCGVGFGGTTDGRDVARKRRDGRDSDVSGIMSGRVGAKVARRKGPGVMRKPPGRVAGFVGDGGGFAGRIRIRIRQPVVMYNPKMTTPKKPPASESPSSRRPESRTVRPERFRTARPFRRGTTCASWRLR